MRSQASIPLPKKGAVHKTTFKTSSNLKKIKKKFVLPQKSMSIANKTLAKCPKKNVSKDVTSKNAEETSRDKCDLFFEIANAASKTNPRSDLPPKKPKNEIKEKNNTGVIINKVSFKKFTKTDKKVNQKPIIDKSEVKTNDIEYIINLDVNKKTPSRFTTAKTLVKKRNILIEKKKPVRLEKTNKDYEPNINKNIVGKCNGTKKSVNKEEFPDKLETQTKDKIETKEIAAPPMGNANALATLTIDTPTSNTERPLKFYISKRRKTSKGIVTASDIFLSMKLKTNTLVSPEPDVDVYTFTEKVDSPKSILSDLRNPISKSVEKVRPIARVRGKTIYKKTEPEKDKYLPNQPIEVDKQPKASKKRNFAFMRQISSFNDESLVTNDENDAEDKPKSIVSKSYKMVARKSSVTGKPFSPIKFTYEEPTASENDTSSKTISSVVSEKNPLKPEKKQKKPSMSDEKNDAIKNALNTIFQFNSTHESINETNNNNDTKESSGFNTLRIKKIKNKKYKRITHSSKNPRSSNELKKLSKDILVDPEGNKDLGEKPSKRRFKLLSMLTRPKKHRMASLNAMVKVNCLYENERRTHTELGWMKTIDRPVIPETYKPAMSKKKDSKSKKSDKLMISNESSVDNPPTRTLRGEPRIRSAGKYWDLKSSTSSSEDSELETQNKTISPEKKKANTKTTSTKSDTEKPPEKMKKTAGALVKRKRNRNEVVMDLKDMIVQKRMASLNATAILAASYEKRSFKSGKNNTSEFCSKEYFFQKSKNAANSGIKSESKNEDTKKKVYETSLKERKQKFEVYSTRREGFCTAIQYPIASTSHTQTSVTANCKKMVGGGIEPISLPQYYVTPPCYQHSQQRIPYVEYRGSPGALNACPKNFLIGPANDKALTAGGPDVPLALAPPEGIFRATVGACVLDAVKDTHSSRKDSSFESEPPDSAGVPHTCMLPDIRGASPKCKMYDVCDNLRVLRDDPGPAEQTGPPYARTSSAEVCALQQPPTAVRRARLGKAMARKNLAAFDNELLLSVPQASLVHKSDDDVLAISSLSVCASMDLSSIKEISKPLVDVKKKKECQTNAFLRKTDAQALREYNCTAVAEENVDVTDSAKTVKRLHSRPKLEIDIKDTQMKDGCKSIGKHVKLQKRRKVSREQTDVRLETVTMDPKKKTSPAKRAIKISSTENKVLKKKKKKSAGSRSKKAVIETGNEDLCLKKVAAVAKETMTAKAMTKKQLLVDKLARKKRPDDMSLSKRNLNLVKLLFSIDENVTDNCVKKTNINYNVVNNANAPDNGVRPNMIATAGQLVKKKLANKYSCKVKKINSKITRLPNVKCPEEDYISKRRMLNDCIVVSVEKIEKVNKVTKVAKDTVDKTGKAVKPKAKGRLKSEAKVDAGEEFQKARTIKSKAKCKKEKAKRTKLGNRVSKGTSIEKVVKLLVSKKPGIKSDKASLVVGEAGFPEGACGPSGAVGMARRTWRRRCGIMRQRLALASIAPLAPPDVGPPAPPRWSNGWSFDGDYFISKVCLNNDSRLDRTTRCWARMTHASGDSVARGDNVLLRASHTRAQPFVARVASLWQNLDDDDDTCLFGSDYSDKDPTYMPDPEDYSLEQLDS